MATGAGSERQLIAPACVSRGSEKHVVVKASGGLADIFRRSIMTPWNHRKRVAFHQKDTRRAMS